MNTVVAVAVAVSTQFLPPLTKSNQGIYILYANERDDVYCCRCDAPSNDGSAWNLNTREFLVDARICRRAITGKQRQLREPPKEENKIE